MADDIENGELCIVVNGTHRGKAGRVQDKNVSRSGNVTITVVQENGLRFKTLARNVSRQ